jgi:nucleotide-binding universal stress UspA family protein
VKGYCKLLASAKGCLTEARLEQVDLIVMCSHGESGLKRWVFGSLAQEAVRYSPVPVLVLNEHGLIPSASDIDHPLHVLVALDGSPLSETAIVPTIYLIAALAAPGQGALHLMQVVITPLTYGKFRSHATVDHYLLGQRQLEAETYLGTLVDRLRQGVLARFNLAITWSVTIASDAAEAIIQLAEQPEEPENEGKYDLVAMATHGRGGLRRLLMGSVTEKVLGRTQYPLFIVRPYEVEAQAQQKAETANGERTEFEMPGLSVYF